MLERVKTVSHNGDVVQSAFEDALLSATELFRLPKKTLSVEFIRGQKAIGESNCIKFMLMESLAQLLTDCGKQMSESGDSAKSHFPDFSSVDFDRLVALVLTHGHLDHCGAIVELLLARGIREEPLKVFGTSHTLRIVRRVIEKSGRPELLDAIEPIELSQVQKIGEFIVHAFPIVHSIPGSVCLVIEAGGKKVCVLADFKFVGTDILDYFETRTMLERIGGMTPDLLLVDTTGIDNPGFTQSEIKMLSEFDRIIRANPNKRVIVSLFSTNIRAIARLCEIANFADRPVDYYGTSMAFSFEEFGLARNDQSKFNGKPVVFVTGCQAEPFSVLPRLARHNKRHPIFLHQGDDIVIVAARHIPSSAKRIDEMLGLLRFMIGSDAVITAADRPNLHVSGHGSFGDIAAAIAAVKPTYVAGIHNSHAFRARISDAISAAKLSSEVVPLVAKNGETIEI